MATDSEDSCPDPEERKGRKLLTEKGVAWLDEQLGPSTRRGQGNRFMFTPSQLKWGQRMRALMDKYSRELELPNNYQGDFWKDYGPRLESYLSPKQLKILRDYYPNGPRYVDPPQGGTGTNAL